MDTLAQTELELFVDKHGLDAIVEELAVIMLLKAEHLLGNWQDAQGAARCTRRADILERAANLLRRI